MDLGVTLPTSGPQASPAAIVRMACEAERLGYAAVWTYERLLYPLGDVARPGGPPRPLPAHYRVTYEPLETLAYVAARTATIGLGTSVLAALFHVPVVLARRLATLDQLSGGRVTAGLGQGWIGPEFVAAGVPLRRRGAGFEEFVAALRAAWRPGTVAFDGRFYRIPPSCIEPKPVQAGGIPIVVGASAPAAVDRAARIADGLNPVVVSAEALTEQVTRFRRAAVEAGRDPAALRVIARVNTPITDARMGGSRPFLGGAPEEIAADLATLDHLDIDHVMFTNVRQPPVDEQVRLLDRLMRAADLPVSGPDGRRGPEYQRALSSGAPPAGPQVSKGRVARSTVGDR